MMRSLAQTLKAIPNVDDETAPQLVEAGADVLVSGNYIFKSPDQLGAIEGLKAIDFE